MPSLFAYTAFARVYELGSFSAVGRELGLTQSSISKHIAALEADLGVQLFARTTRKLRPTHDAATLYEGVKHLLDVMDSIHSSLDKGRKEPAGLLKIALPDTYGRIVALPKLALFAERYPKIRLDVRLTRLSEQVVNLVDEGVELGIQIGEINPASMVVARSLGRSEHSLVASPQYLDRQGEPRYPTDLINHNCVIYTGLAHGGRWVFESEHGGRQVIDVCGSFTVNSIDAAYRLVHKGLGIARIPVWMLGDDVQQGRVRILLEKDYLMAMPINIVYQQTRVLSQRARHLINFLLEELYH